MGPTLSNTSEPSRAPQSAPAGSAARAGAQAINALTFNPDHPMGADQFSAATCFLRHIGADGQRSCEP